MDFDNVQPITNGFGFVICILAQCAVIAISAFVLSIVPNRLAVHTPNTAQSTQASNWKERAA